jgi:hypothetical protein
MKMGVDYPSHFLPLRNASGEKMTEALLFSLESPVIFIVQ